MIKRCISVVATKRGSEMVEASIVMPIIVLAIVLLIRLFTFYLSILTTGVNVHANTMELARNYTGVTGKNYNTEECVEMFKGGLLSKNLRKVISVECCFLNEDYLVRGSELVKK